MSFLSRITSKTPDVVPQQVKRLTNRFVSSDWLVCGDVYNTPRTNSSGEIIESLKLVAKTKAENAAKIKKELIEGDVFNLSEQAARTGRDILDFTIEAQSKYTDELNGITYRGGSLSNAQIDKHKELTKLARMAEKVKSNELESVEISNFVEMAKDMPQRHLSLAHDVVDLTYVDKFIDPNIFPSVNFNTLGEVNGEVTTLMGHILNQLFSLSKTNPNAVDLAETVATHSDVRNAKFFLYKFVNLFPFNGTERQAEAAQSLVKPIAKSFLSGSPSLYLDSNCKEQKFFNALSGLCKSDSKPENIKLLSDVIDSTDDIAPNVSVGIDFDEIRLGDTERIVENMKVLPQVLEMAEAKGLSTFDVSGFLTKNVNLN